MSKLTPIVALTLNSPLKVIITSFVISKEACGLQALIFDTVYGSLILFPLLFTLGIIVHMHDAYTVCHSFSFTVLCCSTVQ